MQKKKKKNQKNYFVSETIASGDVGINCVTKESFSSAVNDVVMNCVY